jgi:hypothetical protein
MEVLPSDRTLEFLVSTNQLESAVLYDDGLFGLQMLIFGAVAGCLILMF